MLGERAILIAEIEEIRDRKASSSSVVAPCRVSSRHSDGDQLLRLRERQRLEENRVDHAEDGGVRADAEREREHGDESETGMFEELAKP